MVKLLLAGDVMIGRGIDQVMTRPCSPALYEPAITDARDYVRLAEQAHGPIPAPCGPEYPWGEALAEMNRLAADARIVNLETALTDRGVPWPEKGIHYRSHPSNIRCLRAAGIDTCVLANNHILDWQENGLTDTLDTLSAAGITSAGAGHTRAEALEPAVIPITGGGCVLLFAWTTESSGTPREWMATDTAPGVALLPALGETGLDAVARQIDRHRETGDLVVVSLHWGANWVERIPDEHREFARRLIDVGADLVYGHSSHHPLPVELYRGHLIIYGCGDLLNDYEGIVTGEKQRSDLACLYGVSLERADGALRALEISPFRLRNFRLEKPGAADIAWLGETIVRGSREHGVDLLFGPNGSWQMPTS